MDHLAPSSLHFTHHFLPSPPFTDLRNIRNVRPAANQPLQNTPTHPTPSLNRKEGCKGGGVGWGGGGVRYSCNERSGVSVQIPLSGIRLSADVSSDGERREVAPPPPPFKQSWGFCSKI
ncbi:hypothetical protein CEXT_314301 [Caerostris extrusa]|uniref:Uncharacterized protein n=1 Tax=Caerostris extrusa TaxID=172846 RepID=A0AAV4XGM5_CAEEX|nr:hypothetical protein CEXT_314301 [Caerostris extrusa]